MFTRVRRFISATRQKVRSTCTRLVQKHKRFNTDTLSPPTTTTAPSVKVSAVVHIEPTAVETVAVDAVVVDTGATEATTVETVAVDTVVVETDAVETNTAELTIVEPAVCEAVFDKIDCSQFIDNATSAASNAYTCANEAILSASAADDDAAKSEVAYEAAKAAHLRAYATEVDLCKARDEAALLKSVAYGHWMRAISAMSDAKDAAQTAGLHANASANAADLAYTAMTNTIAAATAGDPFSVAEYAIVAFKATADAAAAASAAQAAADKASTHSIRAIDARVRAERVAAIAEARAASAIAKAKAASATVHVATADEVFPASDFRPFNLNEVFGGDCNNTPLGYLVGDSAKAVFTQDKFEERLKVFQSSVYKDCEWVSGDSYFKREDRIRSACHQLYCLN
ncbi:hypothetical protein FBU31_000720 [Coemansia sp. 'formosensis']|nr:hypothetical protein FBU31_000720 [Coemansia sp. 'formosensis']